MFRKTPVLHEFRSFSTLNESNRKNYRYPEKTKDWFTICAKSCERIVQRLKRVEFRTTLLFCILPVQASKCTYNESRGSPVIYLNELENLIVYIYQQSARGLSPLTRNERSAAITHTHTHNHCRLIMLNQASLITLETNSLNRKTQNIIACIVQRLVSMR